MCCWSILWRDWTGLPQNIIFGKPGTGSGNNPGEIITGFRFYTNNNILDYYAGQKVFRSHWNYRAAIANPETLKNRVDLIAIRAGRSDVNGYYQHILSLIGETPDMIFENRKGDRVEIFDFRKKDS